LETLTAQRVNDARTEFRHIVRVIEQPRDRPEKRSLERIQVSAVITGIEMRADLSGTLRVNFPVEIRPHRSCDFLARQLVQ
jgi:hypothetical protein